MAPAALAQSISLPQALSTAMDANPDLAAARQEIGIADGARKQAGLIPNPTISYDVEDTRRNTSQTTVSLSQTLELGGKRGARVDVATYGQTAAQLELDRRVNGLRADVVQAFYAALRAQTGLDLAKQSLELTERGLRIVDGRVRAGKSSPVEATRAQVQLAEAQLQVRRAETEKATAYQQLAQITGSSVTVFDRLESPTLSPGLPPRTEDLLAKLDQTAEMRQAVVQIDKSDASLGSEKAQRIPNLTVSVGSQYDRSVRERVNTVGLSMPLPLFDRNQGNILSASRRADQARDQRNAVELRLRTETQTALNQWSTAMLKAEWSCRVLRQDHSAFSPTSRRDRNPRLRDGQIRFHRSAGCPAHLDRRSWPIPRIVGSGDQCACAGGKGLWRSRLNRRHSLNGPNIFFGTQP